jgi:hypothetical protein
MCKSNPRATDLLLTQPRSVAPLEHLHHDDRARATHFVGNGQKYHWNANAELVEDATGTVLAELSSTKSMHQHKSGRLVIKSTGTLLNLTDPIVMTALMVQERADERRSYF